MNIRFFNKNFENMELLEKILTILLIPVVITVVLGVTLFRLLKRKNK